MSDKKFPPKITKEKKALEKEINTKIKALAKKYKIGVFPTTQWPNKKGMVILSVVFDPSTSIYPE